MSELYPAGILPYQPKNPQNPMLMIRHNTIVKAGQFILPGSF